MPKRKTGGRSSFQEHATIAYRGSLVLYRLRAADAIMMREGLSGTAPAL
jgi:hypothetical protein